MSEPQSVREMVRDAQREMLGELPPARARELLTKLTGLIGNCNSESREADQIYNVVLLAHLRSTAKANHARIAAECTNEYQRARLARDTKTEIIESVRSLKKCIDSLSEEMRLSR